MVRNHTSSKPSTPFLWVLTIVVATSSVAFTNPSPFDVLVTVLLIWWFAVMSRPYPKDAILPASLLWIFWLGNLASMVGVTHVARSIYFALITGYLVAYFFFIVSVISWYGRRGLRLLLSAYVVAACISLVVAFLTLGGIFPHGLAFTKAGRVAGLFKDPNVLGPFLVAASAIALSRVLSTRAGRGGWITLWGLFAAGVFITFSRAAWVNFLVTTMSVVLLSPYASVRARMRTVVLGFLVLGLAGTLVLTFRPSLAAFATERARIQSYDYTRFRVQADALLAAEARPLGIGPGQSELTFDYATHSTPIRVLVEDGWLAAIAFYIFTLAALAEALVLVRNLPKSARIYLALAASITIGVVANGLVIDTLHWRHVWLFLAAIYGIRSSVRHGTWVST